MRLFKCLGCGSTKGTWTPAGNFRRTTSDTTRTKKTSTIFDIPDNRPDRGSGTGSHAKQSTENRTSINENNHRTSIEEEHRSRRRSVPEERSTVDELPPENIDENLKRREPVVPFEYNTEEPIPHHPKDPADAVLIKEALLKNSFLRLILKDRKLLDEIVETMHSREVAKGEVLIKEGENGTHMYVSWKGLYEIAIEGVGVYETFSDVRVFGELAILYKATRKATIRALKAGNVWVLNGAVFQRLMVEYNVQEREETLAFLEGVVDLNKVGREALEKVASLMQVELFTTGTTIIREGDLGDRFYVIRAGGVTIKPRAGGQETVYERGKYFGELALLKEGAVRQATVTANGPDGVECLTLERQDFIDHFGEVSNFSHINVPAVGRDTKEDVKVHNQKNGVGGGGDGRIRNVYPDIKLTDLTHIGTLGSGGFGRVELMAVKNQPDRVFALKYLKKFDMVENNHTGHVINERRVHMSCDSPFIVKLYNTYRNERCVYFLMETCMGGELFSWLQRQKSSRFQEAEVCFLTACVLEALDYLHKNNIIYRDLKPENLLIDKNGYVKLCDLGYAKQLPPSGRAMTCAGTAEYLAPEMLSKREYTRSVDLWQFGILTYELFTGRTPFVGENRAEVLTYLNIMNGIDGHRVEWPKYINKFAQNLIKRLLTHSPNKRLGCKLVGMQEVREHQWYTGFDWQRLRTQKLTSPIKIELRSPTDMRYFQSCEEDNDTPPIEQSGWDDEFADF